MFHPFADLCSSVKYGSNPRASVLASVSRRLTQSATILRHQFKVYPQMTPLAQMRVRQ
jgi:hypothetical protein